MTYFEQKASKSFFAISRRLGLLPLALTLTCVFAQPAVAGKCDGDALSNRAQQLSAQVVTLGNIASAYQASEGDAQSKLHLGLAASSMSMAATDLIGGDASKALNRMNGVMQHYHLVAWRLSVATAWGKKAEYVKLWEKSESTLEDLLAYRQTLFGCYTGPYL